MSCNPTAVEPHNLARYTLRVAFFCTFLLIAATIAWGQAGVGGLSGVVTDSTGSLLPNADVQLLAIGTNVTKTMKTTATGLYSFAALTPGKYRLTATHEGFKTATTPVITVEVDRTSGVDLQLVPGNIVETVKVEADAQVALNTTDSVIGDLISNETLESVPLNGRDPYLLVQLAPSVVPANGSLNQTGEWNRPGIGVSAFHINGLPEGSLQYLLDGSALTIAGYGVASTSPALTPALDSLQEFRLETSNTSATVRSSGSGVLSLATKSGGNSIHGSAFFFDRPNGMNANDPFNKASQLSAGLKNQPPAFFRRQWGGSFGGPIRKDKIFVFGDYEQTRAQSVSTETTTVPTDDEKKGNFADVPVIYNPFEIDANGARMPFASNSIPVGMQSQVAQNMQKLIPEPNRAGEGPYHSNNFFDAGSSPNNYDKFDVRPDYYINKNHLFFGRYSYMKAVYGNPDHFHNGADPGYYTDFTLGQNALLAYNYTLNSNNLFQMRYSFARHAENQPAKAGLPTLTDLGFPAELAAESQVRALPDMGISGQSGVGSGIYSTGFKFISMYHDASIMLDSIRGRHEVKVGFEWRKDLENMGQPIAPNGSYSFDTTATSSTTYGNDGYSYASYLLGMGNPSEASYSFTKDPFIAEAAPYYAAFAEDTYRVTSKLTVVAGLRWEVIGGRTERFNRLEYFDPNATTTVDGVSLQGGEVFVKNHASPFTSNLKDFGPRLGLNYRVGPKLVAHAGGGIFYGPGARGIGLPATDSDSYGSQTVWNATTFDQYGNSKMLNSVDNPFPNGLTNMSQGTLGLLTNLGGSITTVLRSQPDNSAYNWNAGLQYELARTLTVSADYVASRGLHEYYGNGGGGAISLNQLTFGQIEQYNTQLDSSVPNPYVSIITDPTSPIYHSSTIPLWQSISSYPQFTSGSPGSGASLAAPGLFDTNYNAMVLKAEKKFSSHWTTQAAFTWSKSMSDGNSGAYSYVLSNSGIQNWHDLKRERSVSAQDVPVSFIVASSYDLPIGAGRLINVQSRVANEVIGGWSINAQLAASGGVPVPVSGSFPNQSRFFNQRPDLTCDPAKGAPHSTKQWFLPACYAAPASPYVPGNSPQLLSGVRGDGTHNLDLSLFKSVHLGGERNVQFRAEFFNFTNTTQLSLPNATWNPNNLSTFGQVTSASSTPRQIQFGVRYSF